MESNFKALDSTIAGYNPTPSKTKPNEIDGVVKYCKENDISYGEYQRREFFNELPATIKRANTPRHDVRPKKIVSDSLWI